jgi:hypothetical protein
MRQGPRAFTIAPRTAGVSIASTHAMSSLVLEDEAAKNALLSQEFWVTGSDRAATNFSASVFLRLEPSGEITVKNPDLSAILLVSVRRDRSAVSGALNPSPTYKLPTAALWPIPFVYLMDWPVEQNTVRPAWSMGKNRTYEFPHRAIQ